LHERRALTQAIDRTCQLLESSADAKSMGVHYERAYQVLSSNRTRRAFAIGAEPDRMRDAYGRTRLGQSCLLARRLVEAGVPFVTVSGNSGG
jgi:hypothetical protein